MSVALKWSRLFVVSSNLLIAGCQSAEESCVFQPETSAINLNVPFVTLQDSLVNIDSKSSLVALLTRHPIVRDEIFRRAEYPSDSVYVQELYDRFNNPHLDTLLLETKRVFGDLSTLHRTFSDAFTNIKFYYPEFVAPKIVTLISGLDTDLYVSDSLIVVSLDFFLGPGAKYRPRMYDYLLRKYDPDDIVPSCLLIYGISGRFNQNNMNDKSVLADMVAYGKSFYFAKHMMPCIPDSTLIWYTPEDIKGARDNEDLIWKRFVESQVLFSTSHKVKQDYLGERPITTQVGERCPGRIGQWVGWQIVQAYAEKHPETSLPQIMNVDNAQRMFKDSGYKPSYQ